MSVSRSAAHLRQLRASNSADAGLTARTEVLDADVGAAGLRKSPARHSATLGTLRAQSPPHPVAAWTEGATTAPKTKTTHRKRVSQPLPGASVWPPPDYHSTELPALGTTHILAVKIDRSGAPAAAKKPAASVSAHALDEHASVAVAAAARGKKKPRGVVVKSWRTGITAVKFECTLQCGKHDVVCTACCSRGMRDCCAAVKYLRSGITLGQPRTLFWADAAETVPLRSLALSHWDVTSSQLIELSKTHTSVVDIELVVSASAVGAVWGTPDNCRPLSAHPRTTRTSMTTQSHHSSHARRYSH